MTEKLTYAERLDLERNRDGKPPLTSEERYERLLGIRDGALIWAERAVALASPKGGSSAMEYYTFACEEIGKLDNDVSAHTGINTLGWNVDGADIDTAEA